MCNIQVQNINYTVLLEWSNWLTGNSGKPDFVNSLKNLNATCLHLKPELPVHAESEHVIEDAEPTEDEKDSEHELPFKVVGVTATSHRQTYLSEANKRIYGEVRSDVDVRIQADPANKHDANAICVQVNYGSGWKLVGFLLRDLTKYVHPILNTDKLLNVTIGSIRFRAHWLTPGFYMKLLIKRKGVWPQEVIRASRKVQ